MVGRGSAVRNVHVFRIAAEVEPVSPDAGREEIDLLKLFPIDHVNSVRVHVCYIEDFAVRRDPAVLRHALRCQSEMSENLLRGHVNLDHLARELTRR